MNAQALSFSFKENQVRTLVDEQDNIWFCRKDILEILGLGLNTKLLNSLDPKGIAKSDPLNTAGGKQQLIFINEPNLYRVIFKSEKPQAKDFQNWVFDEVLPAIRKHGAYVAPHKEDDKSFIETFKNFCLQNNYSAREVEMFNWFGEMKLKQGYAIAMAKIEKENAEKESVERDNKNGVFLPIHVAESLLETVKWHRKNEQYMLDVIRAMRNAAEITLRELPTIGLYAERDAMTYDHLYWYLKELDQEQKQLENKA